MKVLFDYFFNSLDDIPKFLSENNYYSNFKSSRHRNLNLVGDFIASMTDKEALETFNIKNEKPCNDSGRKLDIVNILRDKILNVVNEYIEEKTSSNHLTPISLSLSGLKSNTREITPQMWPWYWQSALF